MNWYYAEAGQQTGPVDDAALEQLAAAGKITVETLVWREGLENWIPYGQARPDAAGPPPPLVPGVGEAVCAECHGLFPIDETIRFGEVRVCAKCKPAFVQKLQEGVETAGHRDFNYAGVGIRFAAIFLDALITSAVTMSLNFAFGFGFGGPMQGAAMPAGLTTVAIAVFAVEMVLPVAYETFFIGKYGATLGKMACKIRVVTAEGADISYLRALGRHFAKYLSSMICLIGYLMAIWDPEKRGLHDRICNTRVIMR